MTVKKTIIAIVSANFLIYLALAALGHSLFNKKEVDVVFLNLSKDDIINLFNYSIGKGMVRPAQVKRSLVYYQMLADYLDRPALAYANQGYCYFYLGDFNKAEDVYHKAIAQLPEFYMFYYDLGMIAMARGDDRQAYGYFEESMNLLTTGRNRYFAVLETIKRDAQMGKYHDDYKIMAGRFEHDLRRNLYHLLEVAGRLNEIEQMRRSAYQGLVFFPDDPRFYFWAGKANLMLGKKEQALPLLNEALTRQPDYQEALSFRGLLYKEIGLGREAVLDLRKAEQATARETMTETEERRDLHFFYDRGAFFMMLSI